MFKRVVPYLTVALLAGSGLAACGSSNSSSTSTPAATVKPAANTTTTATGADGVAAAQSAVDAAVKGLYRDPAPGPAAQKGKNVWIVTCGMVVPGCSAPALGAQEAAKSLGWKTTIADGKITPAGYTAALKQALAAKPDGIIAIAMDCTNAKAAYQQVHDAGIPLIGVYQFDCNDPSVGGPKLFTSPINTGTGADTAGTAKWFQSWGKLHADYMIAKTNGKAKVVAFTHPEFLLQTNEDKGFFDELKTCPGCTVVEKTSIPITDLAGPAAPQKVAASLQKHSEANAVYFPSDTLLGVSAQVLRTTGRSSQLTVVGGEGYPNTQQMLKDGTADALVGNPAAWLGWCGADGLNRILAKQPVADCGIDFQILTKDNVASLETGPKKQWEPSIDFQSAFKQMWAK